MCEFYNSQYNRTYLTLMPCNLYGPNDNYDLNSSHVLPALIRKFHEAKVLNASHTEVWGSGNPKREFLHVDDLAAACIFLMKKYNDKEIVNIGTGLDISIKELALLIKSTVGFNGEIYFDKEKPDGTPRKLLDVSKLNNLGWEHKINLVDGVKSVYEDYKEKYSLQE